MPSSLEAFLVVLFLLPGFVGLIVYDSVAAGPKRETADKVVTALVITLLANVLVPASGLPALLGGVPKPAPPGIVESLLAAVGLAAAAPHAPDILNATISAGLLPVTATAAAIGLVFGWIRNKGWIYDSLAALRITRRTGAIDVWHQVFSRSGKIWVRILFRDGTILVGWPKYYSEDGATKELFLARAVWHHPLQPAGRGRAPRFRSEVVDGPGVLVTAFDQVHSIEVVDAGN